VARYVAVRKIPILPKAPDLINRQKAVEGADLTAGSRKFAL
jgi:hypothetical protein